MIQAVSVRERMLQRRRKESMRRNSNQNSNSDSDDVVTGAGKTSESHDTAALAGTESSPSSESQSASQSTTSDSQTVISPFSTDFPPEIVAIRDKSDLLFVNQIYQQNLNLGYGNQGNSNPNSINCNDHYSYLNYANGIGQLSHSVEVRMAKHLGQILDPMQIMGFSVLMGRGRVDPMSITYQQNYWPLSSQHTNCGGFGNNCIQTNSNSQFGPLSNWSNSNRVTARPGSASSLMSSQQQTTRTVSHGPPQTSPRRPNSPSYGGTTTSCSQRQSNNRHQSQSWQWTYNAQNQNQQQQSSSSSHGNNRDSTSTTPASSRAGSVSLSMQQQSSRYQELSSQNCYSNAMSKFILPSYYSQCADCDLLNQLNSQIWAISKREHMIKQETERSSRAHQTNRQQLSIYSTPDHSLGSSMQTRDNSNSHVNHNTVSDSLTQAQSDTLSHHFPGTILDYLIPRLKSDHSHTVLQTSESISTLFANTNNERLQAALMDALFLPRETALLNEREHVELEETELKEKKRMEKQDLERREREEIEKVIRENYNNVMEEMGMLKQGFKGNGKGSESELDQKSKPQKSSAGRQQSPFKLDDYVTELADKLQKSNERVAFFRNSLEQAVELSRQLENQQVQNDNHNVTAASVRLSVNLSGKAPDSESDRNDLFIIDNDNESANMVSNNQANTESGSRKNSITTYIPIENLTIVAANSTTNLILNQDEENDNDFLDPPSLSYSNTNTNFNNANNVKRTFLIRRRPRTLSTAETTVVSQSSSSPQGINTEFEDSPEDIITTSEENSAENVLNDADSLDLVCHNSLTGEEMNLNGDNSDSNCGNPNVNFNENINLSPMSNQQYDFTPSTRIGSDSQTRRGSLLSQFSALSLQSESNDTQSDNHISELTSLTPSHHIARPLMTIPSESQIQNMDSDDPNYSVTENQKEDQIKHKTMNTNDIDRNVNPNKSKSESESQKVTAPTGYIPLISLSSYSPFPRPVDITYSLIDALYSSVKNLRTGGPYGANFALPFRSTNSMISSSINLSNSNTNTQSQTQSIPSSAAHLIDPVPQSIRKILLHYVKRYNELEKQKKTDLKERKKKFKELVNSQTGQDDMGVQEAIERVMKEEFGYNYSYKQTQQQASNNARDSTLLHDAKEMRFYCGEFNQKNYYKSEVIRNQNRNANSDHSNNLNDIDDESDDHTLQYHINRVARTLIGPGKKLLTRLRNIGNRPFTMPNNQLRGVSSSSDRKFNTSATNNFIHNQNQNITTINDHTIITEQLSSYAHNLDLSIGALEQADESLTYLLQPPYKSFHDVSARCQANLAIEVLKRLYEADLMSGSSSSSSSSTAGGNSNSNDGQNAPESLKIIYDKEIRNLVRNYEEGHDLLGILDMDDDGANRSTSNPYWSRLI